tara:strand:- start:11693 stop:12076 length:384 start_codon:yes stop_codon:yes gene_type:complete
MSTLNNYISIRPIQSEEERLEVYEEADKDGNRHPLMPTHVVKKGEDIVGAFCLYSPTVYWWMHTQKVKGRDSFSIFQTMSALLANDGVSKFILPCEPESPYFSLLSKKLSHHSGTEGGDWRLFINEA